MMHQELLDQADKRIKQLLADNLHQRAITCMTHATKLRHLMLETELEAVYLLDAIRLRDYEGKEQCSPQVD